MDRKKLDARLSVATDAYPWEIRNHKLYLHLRELDLWLLKPARGSMMVSKRSGPKDE